jgi:hypothetical protein
MTDVRRLPLPGAARSRAASLLEGAATPASAPAAISASSPAVPRPVATRQGARPSSFGVPAHVGILIGLSAGGYALSLAAVTGLQSHSEAALTAQRAPALAKIDALNTHYANLEAQLAAAQSAYDAAAAAYNATSTQFQAMESSLSDLAAAVSSINGTAASLPAGVSLPSVSRSVSTASAPVVHATTTASGVP